MRHYKRDFQRWLDRRERERAVMEKACAIVTEAMLRHLNTPPKRELFSGLQVGGDGVLRGQINLDVLPLWWGPSFANPVEPPPA